MEVINKFTLLTPASSPMCNPDWPGSNCDEEKEIIFNTGKSYQVKIKSTSKREISLQTEVSKKTEDFIFKVSSNHSIPENEGTFEILSEESGQPVNAYGILKTSSHKGDIKEGYFDCTYVRTELVCHHDRERGQVCGWEPVTHFGEQWAKYYLVEYFQNLIMQIKSKNNKISLGQLKASRSWEETVILERGDCR